MSTDVVQTKANTLKKLMESARKEIEAALPKHVSPERMLRIAMTEARKNPRLLDCEPASFLGAVIQASQLGLEPGGALGHCWLIPYNNKDKKTLEVNFQIGYRGMIDIAMRSERVSHISARAVYEGDQFDWEYGLHEGLTHKPCANPGKLTHVYCVVHLKNGCKMFDVMNIAEVERAKSSSKSNSGPWVTHYDEMAKKSVIRRLFKMMPVSIELQNAVGLDELDEAGESQHNSAVIETTGRDVTPANGNGNGAGKSLGEKLKGKKEIEPPKAPNQDDDSPDMFENFK